MILMTGLEAQPSPMRLLGLGKTPGQSRLVDQSGLVIIILSQKMADLPVYLPG